MAKIDAYTKAGFFYLEIPVDVQPLVERALCHVKECYEEPNVRQLSLDGFSGFHDRLSFQVESLYLGKKHWNQHLPEGFKELSSKMLAIALELLKKTLSFCNIPEADWNVATGGSTDEKGQVHFTLNHYRPEKECEGIATHQDYGQITVLFVNEPGLQAKVNGKWEDVAVKQNCFVINFGKALETYVNNTTILNAAWHRVPRVEKERISFGIFVDNANESEIFKREVDGTCKKVSDSYKKYLEDNFKESYSDPDKK